jgi:hypothetical protein
MTPHCVTPPALIPINPATGWLSDGGRGVRGDTDGRTVRCTVGDVANSDLREVILAGTERRRALWEAHEAVISSDIGESYPNDPAVSLIFAASRFVNPCERAELDRLSARISGTPGAEDGA